jgi:hypothetical protein
MTKRSTKKHVSKTSLHSATNSPRFKKMLAEMREYRSGLCPQFRPDDEGYCIGCNFDQDSHLSVTIAEHLFDAIREFLATDRYGREYYSDPVRKRIAAVLRRHRVE